MPQPPPPLPPEGASHYELLQVQEQASAEELRRAFRSLSKRYHPDTTALPDREAAAAFRRLQQAYAVLIDPSSRRAYDESRRRRQAVAAIRFEPSVAVSRPVPVRRALSGGEWFALVLLACALVLSLVLGLGVAWARGAELVRQPSWWRAAAPAALGQPAPVLPGPSAALSALSAASPPPDSA
ncbi:MAG: J domain-containing protein [Synechococcaceae cyanobacterium]|nr:J domain-containing protein [Synechococcaceae cyanobacterium]